MNEFLKSKVGNLVSKGLLWAFISPLVISVIYVCSLAYLSPTGPVEYQPIWQLFVGWFGLVLFGFIIGSLVTVPCSLIGVGLAIVISLKKYTLWSRWRWGCVGCLAGGLIGCFGLVSTNLVVGGFGKWEEILLWVYQKPLTFLPGGVIGCFIGAGFAVTAHSQLEGVTKSKNDQVSRVPQG